MKAHTPGTSGAFVSRTPGEGGRAASSAREDGYPKGIHDRVVGFVGRNKKRHPRQARARYRRTVERRARGIKADGERRELGFRRSVLRYYSLSPFSSDHSSPPPLSSPPRLLSTFSLLHLSLSREAAPSFSRILFERRRERGRERKRKKQELGSEGN